MDTSELAAAVDSIMDENKVKSIFDPPDAPPTSHRAIPTPSPLHFGPTTSNMQNDSSDEETRAFILKHDGFMPKTILTTSTPRVKLRKTPRMRNAPTCKYFFKKGARKGELCGNFCKVGDEFCTRHTVTKKKPPVPCFSFETMAVKSRFERLKASRKYKLLHTMDRTVFLQNDGKILKVRLPECLNPIPKTGSFLKFEKTGQGLKPKPMWESV